MGKKVQQVEVAYALPDRQEIVALMVEPGTTLREAIDQSGIEERFGNLQITEDMVGVFGRRRPFDYPLREGDRVEIYRPLVADPKEVRRQKAENR